MTAPGYQPVGIRPSSFEEEVLMTATALIPPQVTKSRRPSGDIAAAVGAMPGVLTANGFSGISRRGWLVFVSMTETLSLLLLAT